MLASIESLRGESSMQTVLYDMMLWSGKTEDLPSDSLIKAKYFLNCMASDFPGITRSNTKEMLLVGQISAEKNSEKYGYSTIY